MKNLIVLSILCMLTLSSFAQYKKAKLESPMTAGFVMTAGGVAMTLGGFLTTADVYWVSTGSGNVQNQSNSNKGYWKTQPFYAQGPRFYVIVGGATITLTGLITTLSSRK